MAGFALRPELGLGSGYGACEASRPVFAKAAFPGGVARAEKPGAADVTVEQLCSRSLDMFKGVLVIFMTFAHVDLTLMHPWFQFYSPVPHFIGNVAAGLCFLGFMFAYGFSCDRAYLAHSARRSTAEQRERAVRSALLPVAAAWVCGFAWAFICFKFPMDAHTAWMILSFRLAVGNGPDFLLCFPICLLAMLPLRPVLNRELSAGQTARRRWLCSAALLAAPMALTQVVVADCTGWRKYLNYFVECNARELWSSNLPALPHLFFFNLGVLASRGLAAGTAQVRGELFANRGLAVVGFVVATAAFAVLSVPLMAAWATNYGNVAVMTKWGPVIRGFSGGPSPWWLVGNLFGLEVLLTTCVCFEFVVERAKATLPGRLLECLVSELEHLGANVLMYLVVADICLAGLSRAAFGQYPLDVYGGAATTAALLLVTRFLIYLASSGRRPGASGHA